MYLGEITPGDPHNFAQVDPVPSLVGVARDKPEEEAWK